MLAITIAVLLLLFTPTTGHAQTPPELFTPVDPPALSQNQQRLANEPEIMRQTYVTVDMPVMTNAAAALTKDAKAPTPQKLTLNLFPDASFVVILDRSYRSPGSSNTGYFGRVDGAEHSDVSIVIFKEDSTITAVIRPGDGRLFNVSGVNGATHLIEEIDESKLPPLMPPLKNGVIVPEGIEQKGSEAPADSLGIVTPNPDGKDSGDIIDVIISYSGAAVVDIGEGDSPAATLTRIIDDTNRAFAISGVGTQLRLVYTHHDVDHGGDRFLTEDSLVFTTIKAAVIGSDNSNTTNFNSKPSA